MRKKTMMALAIVFTVSLLFGSNLKAQMLVVENVSLQAKSNFKELKLTFSLERTAGGSRNFIISVFYFISCNIVGKGHKWSTASYGPIFSENDQKMIEVVIPTFSGRQIKEGDEITCSLELRTFKGLCSNRELCSKKIEK